MEGYFLPPFTFTGEEATMLLFGSGLAATHFDAGKIEAVFSNKLRDEGKLLKESIHLVNYDVVCQNGTAERLREIRGAILDRKTIRFRYHTRHATGVGTSQRNTREADPYGLMHAGTAWYLTAHCHLRQNIRHFRLDRITGLEVLSKEFVRPSDFSRKPAEVEQRTTTVRALFDPDTAPWVLPHRNGRYCLRPVGHASVLSDK